MRNTLINLSLLLGSILVCFGLLELGLRITGLVQVGPHPPLIYQQSSDPAISYELIPSLDRKAYRSTVTTNALGLRSSEIDASRPKIAVIGDSITFGYGVENDETIAARLEAQLPTVQFLNAGVPGYHLGQETALYRERIQALHPISVILVFHPNDMNIDTGWLDSDGVLRSSKEDRSTRVTNICHPIEEGILGWIPGRCFLDTHSAIYVALKKLVMLKTMQQALHADEQASLEHPEVDRITDAQITTYKKQLQAFNALLPQQMKKIFVIWPERELHSVSRPKIKALAAAQGFTVIDLYDTFGNTARTLSWDTVHPHPETIQKAAEIIANVFK